MERSYLFLFLIIALVVVAYVMWRHSGDDGSASAGFGAGSTELIDELTQKLEALN